MTSKIENMPLREICTLIVDCPHATPEWTASGYIVLRNQNIKNGRLDLSNPSYTDNHNYRYRIRRGKPTAGDIVITREAPMGEVCRIPSGIECCLGQRQVLLRPNPELVDGRYLLYALQSPFVQHQIGWSEGTGSTVSNLRIPLLEALNIPYPNFALQKAVVNLLGTIDDRIDLLKQTNQTLEAIAQTIFKSWFVNFDPVHAKQQGVACAGINAETAELFPDSFEESEFGQIPKGWEVVTLGDLIVPKKGKSITKAKCIEGDIPVVAGGLEPAYYHNKSNIKEPAITISASGANAGFVRLYLQDIWASDCSYINENQTKSVFYWYNFLKLNQEKIYLMQQGAAQPHIYPSDLMRLKLCTPKNEKIVEIFNQKVSPLFKKIRISYQQIQTLSKIRDALLPRLISGKLDVSAIEAQLEEMA